MSKLPKTRYASTDPEAVELGWKLKRVNETHAMRQRALVDEYRAKSEALTDASQAPRHNTDGAQVVRKMPVAVQLDKMGEYL